MGWVCHRGSFADCMPLVSSNGNSTLIFSGEDFRDVDGGHVGTRNAQYLLDIYSRLGEAEFLRQLNGSYSGVIVNQHAREVTLFNDRYGMGRLYVHQGAEEFLFASEAKALLKIRPALRSINPAALAESLRLNCVTGYKTLFRGISVLPNAAGWKFEPGSVRPKDRRYFDFKEWETQDPLDSTRFYPRFVETISRVIPRYASEVGQVAISLTAGLDTRTILAALPQGASVPCYTFGGLWGEVYDIRTARRLAALAGFPFNAITLKETFLQRFEDFARRSVYISDGLYDAFGAHDLYFNEQARQIAPVRLTGKLGSEVVRTRRLISITCYPSDFFTPAFKVDVVDRTRAFGELHGQPGALTSVVSDEIRAHEFPRISVEQSQLTQRTPYLDNELIALMYRAPEPTRADGTLQERYVRETAPALARVPTNLGRFVTANRAATRLLTILMRGLFKVEYVYLLAAPHWMTRLDRVLEPLSPERILAGRQKWEGYRIWIRTHFADFVRDTLFAPGAQYKTFLNQQTVEAMVGRHLAGTHNYLNEINRALTLEILCSSLLKP